MTENNQKNNLHAQRSMTTMILMILIIIIIIGAAAIYHSVYVEPALRLLFNVKFNKNLNNFILFEFWENLNN